MLKSMLETSCFTQSDIQLRLQVKMCVPAPKGHAQTDARRTSFENTLTPSDGSCPGHGSSGSISEVIQTFLWQFFSTNSLPAPHHSPGLLGQSVTRAQAFYLSAYINPLQPITFYYFRGCALTRM